MLKQSELTCGLILYHCLHRSGERKDPRKLILIGDTGASYVLTPFRSDFICYVKCGILIKDMTNINRVVDIGTILHNFINSNVEEVFLIFVSYHLTQHCVQ